MDTALFTPEITQDTPAVFHAPSCSLFFGCCLDVMKGIESGSVDMVCADLPYGTTSCKWDSVIPLDALWAEYKRVCKPHAAIVLTATQPFTAALVMSNPKWFKHEWVWHKSKSGSAFTAKYRPLARHESVLVFGKGRVTYNPIKREGKPYKRARIALGDKINNHGIGFNGTGIFSENDGFRYPESVIFFQQKWRRQDQVHPTQKPVELMEYLIRTYSNEGQTVLDNSMGSGTTGVACANTGRRFIGIEKDADFFRVASERISSANDRTMSTPSHPLWLRLTDPGKGFYWHCHKRKKMPPIEGPQKDFGKMLWPGKGLTWMAACDCGEVASRITAPGVYDVACGEYHITATTQP